MSAIQNLLSEARLIMQEAATKSIHMLSMGKHPTVAKVDHPGVFIVSLAEEDQLKVHGF
uniref:Eukaryotic translation initiation factor 1B n=1 Tax=Leymus chinensis TaxID=52714 RepID=E2FYL4_LEYCH|nr:eukaryotic translation initiation factor 1B [Leymus chinensis]